MATQIPADLVATVSSNRGRQRSPRTFFVLALLMTLSVAGQRPARGAEPSRPPAEQLSQRQQEVAKKYQRLEQILLRMSELTATSDPSRAALLTKAVAESKQRLIGVQFASLIDQLGKDELAKALDGQQKLDVDLAELLKLLLSENRSKRLASEKARIRQYLQQLNRIINQQKSLQARTAGGAGQPQKLSKQQGSLGDQTGGLADEIRQNEEQYAEATRDEQTDDAPTRDPNEDESKDTSLESAEPKSEDGKSPNGSKPGDQEAEPSESGKPAAGDQSGSPPQGDPTESPSEGQPGDASQESTPSSSQDEQAHPARERLEVAKKRMLEAQKKLKEAEREGAGEDQEQAIRQLQQAKAELERILRQLREEEIEQVLVALEARLVKMLQMQRDVYEGTERLDKASANGLTHEQEIEAGRLSSREVEIVTEADKALMLLREDGSAVAMPEALSLAREDMQQVASRLARANVGKVTLAVEEDIVIALEEMLEAVRQAMEDAEERRQNAQQGQPGMPQDPSLIDALAELRMIRSLQLRVNTRTARYSEMITGKHAETPELLDALIRLADRQQRVYRITTDLEAGKNR